MEDELAALEAELTQLEKSAAPAVTGVSAGPRAPQVISSAPVRSAPPTAAQAARSATGVPAALAHQEDVRSSTTPTSSAGPASASLAVAASRPAYPPFGGYGAASSSGGPAQVLSLIHI